MPAHAPKLTAHWPYKLKDGDKYTFRDPVAPYTYVLLDVTAHNDTYSMWKVLRVSDHSVPDILVNWDDFQPDDEPDYFRYTSETIQHVFMHYVAEATS